MTNLHQNSAFSHSNSGEQRSGCVWRWGLTIAFALSLIMGTGPGILLVNRPETIAGIPLVYAWGILWYLVQVTIALLANHFLWQTAVEPEAKDS